MRRQVLIGAAVATAALAGPAYAGHRSFPPVTVTLDVSIGHDSIDHATCTLSVPRDHNGFASGFDALDQAVKNECIKEYRAVDYGAYGRFLTCIDEFCGQDAPTWLVPAPTAYVGTTWTFTVNGVPAQAGLDSHNLKANEEIGLTYSPYACVASPFVCAT